jgi:hypothetical protein
MLVPTILFFMLFLVKYLFVMLYQIQSYLIKSCHVSTSKSNISSIRCCSHRYLMNSVKLAFKFLYMKEKSH